MTTYAPFMTDSYKLGHMRMYPTGTQKIYSNLTENKNLDFLKEELTDLINVQASPAYTFLMYLCG